MQRYYYSLSVLCMLFMPLMLAANDGAIDTKQPVKQIERSHDRGNCQALGDALEKCKKYKCTMPYPQKDKGIIEHQILGYVGDELLCHHTQTIPDKGVIECRYSKTMRKLLAKQFNQNLPLNQEEVRVIAESFPIYCDIIR